MNPYPDTAALYFAVTGDFDPDDFTRETGIRTVRSHLPSDLRADGKPFGFGACYTKKLELMSEGYYPPDLEAGAHRLLDRLERRCGALAAFREEHRVTYCLKIVLELDHRSEGAHPSIPTDRALLERLRSLNVELDIDYYIL